MQKGKIRYRLQLVFLLVVSVFMLQTVAADPAAGHRLLANVPTAQAMTRQRAKIVLHALPITSSANLGDIVELSVKVSNSGNLDAEDVSVELWGGDSLADATKRLDRLAAGDSKEVVFQVELLGWRQSKQQIRLRASSPTLLHAVNATVGTRIKPEQASMDARISLVDDEKRPFPNRIISEQRYKFGDIVYPSLHFELTDAASLGTEAKINLTNLVAAEQMRQVQFELEFENNLGERTFLATRPESFDNSLRFTPQETGTYRLYVGEHSGRKAGKTAVANNEDDAPGGWTPTFNEPAVSEYTGSASYTYPILMPPGVNGLQPNLSLNYSSNVSDGVTKTRKQNDPFGWGWQLGGLIDIIQTVEFCDDLAICPKNTHRNDEGDFVPGVIEFTLNIGGAGYELFHEDGIELNGYSGRYFLKGNSSIYVAYCGAPGPGSTTNPAVCEQADVDDGTTDGYANSPGQQTGTFWVVKTSDNTTHRIGYEATSEQELLKDDTVLKDEAQPHKGYVDFKVDIQTSPDMGPWALDKGYGHALRWRVDKSFDSFGNTIRYQYDELLARKDEVNNTGEVLNTVYTRASYIKQIDYGFEEGESFNQSLHRIRFQKEILNRELFGRIPSTVGVISWQLYRMTAIDVLSGASAGNHTSIRSYQLQWDDQKYGHDDGDAYPGITQSPYCAEQNTNNYDWLAGLLVGIVELDGNGQNILGESGADATANAAFDYQFLRTGAGLAWRAGLDRWCHPYMSHISTLYGPADQTSTVQFDYDESLNIPYSGADEEEDWANPVVKKIVRDGRGAKYRTDYSYGTPHYIVYNIDEHDSGKIRLSGFHEVTSTISEVPGGVHHKQKTRFKLSRKYYYVAGTGILLDEHWPFNGRIETQGVYSSGTNTASEPDIQKTSNNWVFHNVGTSNGAPDVKIVVLQNSTVTDYRGAGATTTTTNKEYDEYGTPKIVTQSGSGATQETITLYVHNAESDGTTWLVGLPWESETRVDGVLASKTRYRYDGAGCGSLGAQIPTHGLVTAVDAYNPTSGLDPYPYAFDYNGGDCGDSNWLTSRNYYGHYLPYTDNYGSAKPWHLIHSFTPGGQRTTYVWDASNPALLRTKMVASDAATSSSSDATTSFDYGTDAYPWVAHEVTHPDGQKSTYAFDTFGRLTNATTPSASAGLPSTTIAYNDNAVPLEVATEQGGIITTVQYDVLGRAISQKVSGIHSTIPDIFTTMSYNVLGTMVCQSGPLTTNTACESADDKTKFEYDELGDLRLTTHPDDDTTVRHLVSPHEWRITDRGGQSTTYSYDFLGRLLSVTPPDGETTSYTYSQGANLHQVAPPEGNATITMHYDLLGRKIKMEDPDMGTWTYQYDLDGNLLQQIDAKEQRLCFYYDGLYRLTDKTRAETGCGTTPTGTILAHYTYNRTGVNFGLVEQITGGSGEGAYVETFGYDDRDRLISHSRQIGSQPAYVQAYGDYDDLERPTKMTYPNQEVVNMAYDGQLAKSLDSSVLGETSLPNLVQIATYTERSQLDALTLGNGTLVDYEYETGDLFRLKKITHENIASYDYDTYDDMGNIKKLITDITGFELDTQDFTYDNLYRLDTAIGQGIDGYYYNLDYSYTSSGNIHTITSKSSANAQSGTTRTYSYDPLHPHAVISTGIGDRYEYDANGNMDVREDESGNYAQTFDVENRLVSVVKTSTDGLSIETTTETQFFYDANGIRILTVECAAVCSADGSNIVSRIYTPFPDYEEQYNLVPATVAKGEASVESPADVESIAAQKMRISSRRVTVPTGATRRGQTAVSTPKSTSQLAQASDDDFPSTELIPTVVREGQRFGRAVAVSGEFAVVGSHLDDDLATQAGSAYVYRWNGTTWVEFAKLLANDGHHSAQFGNSVAIDGDVIVVGAKYNDHLGNNRAGAAYVYRWNGANWEEEQKLTASDGAAGDNFGIEVDIERDRIVVGAYFANTLAPESGSAYVYQWDGQDWVEEQQLIPNDGQTDNLFGHDVAINGNTIAVTAVRDDTIDTDAGAAYIFTHDGASWQQSQKLYGHDTAIGDHFGASVALEGNNLLIGATRNIESGPDAGAAYLFSYDGTTWTETQKLLPNSHPNYNGYYGNAVALYGEVAVVAAYVAKGETGPDDGKVYVYQRDGSAWGQIALLSDDTPSDGYNWFGISVALEGTSLFIGSFQNDDHGENAGAAFVYDIPVSSFKVLPHDGQPMDHFGQALALDGHTAVIGAYSGGTHNSGAAYIVEWNGTNWIESAKLLPSNQYDWERFGQAVDIDQDVVVVGSPFDNENGDRSGSVTVFRRDGATWDEEAHLLPNEVDAEDQFGYSVSVDGDILAIGSILDNDQGTNAGAVYIYEYNNGNWQQVQKLTAATNPSEDFFGADVVLDNHRLLVGANHYSESESAANAAYIFHYDGSTWEYEQTLIGSDVENADAFGQAVALDGNTAVISSLKDDEQATNAGAAYVFTYDGTSWVEQQKLMASDGEAEDQFAIDVALSNGLILIGAFESDDDNFIDAGSAYTFLWDGNEWIERDKLSNWTSSSENAYMGRRVAVDDTTALVGSHWNSELDNRVGAALIFELPYGSATYPAIADAHVRHDSPNSNYGDEDYLRIQENEYDGYLKFEVDELEGYVTKATIRLRAESGNNDGSSDGGTLYFVSDNGWSEGGIKANNAPDHEAYSLDSVQAVNPSQWVEFDVTPKITGNGIYSFALVNESSNGVDYHTKEANDFHPELLLTVSNEGVAPTADFILSATTVSVDETIDFIDRSVGTPTEWRWEFDDNSSHDTSQDTSHSYDSAGSYTVSLRAENDFGHSTKTAVIEVIASPDPLEASFRTDDRVGEASHTVTFVDMSLGEPVHWLWEFEGGETRTGEEVSFTYNTDGLYTVSLTVTNAAGETQTITKTDYISVGSFNLPRTVRDEFNNQVYDGNDGTDPWSGDWIEFGDNGGPNGTDVSVYTDDGVQPWQLLLRKAERGLSRSADLSSATDAILSLDYRRRNLNSNADYVLLEISSDGSSWDELDRIGGGASDSDYTTVSYDVSSYTSSQTAVRFTAHVADDNSSGRVFLDNIQIAYSDGSPPPPPPGPEADFTVTKQTPEEGETITFTDESTGNPTYWRWDLGDGTIVENQTSVAHSYSNEGTYTVELFVSNANGSDTEEKVGYITVTNDPPPPPPTGERTVRDEFNHQAYNNNDGTDDWSSDWVELSDDNSGPLSGFLAVVTDVDDYQLKVERNNRSIYRTADLTGAETATLSFDYRRHELSNGTQLVRVEVSSTGPTGTWTELDSIVGPGTDASYTTLSYDISNHISNETTLRLYNVGTVEGQYVLFDNIQIAFTTNDPPPPPGPEADFTVTKQTPEEGETITFTDESTGNPTYWRWDLGDGTIVENQTSVAHSYSNEGTYTVKLEVSNANGSDIEEKVDYITVTNDPPPPSGPEAEFTVTKQTPEEGETITFTDESTGNPTYWRWDLGDGTIVENQTSVMHSYSNEGSYTVELFVSNANGSDIEEKVGYITVTNDPPPPPPTGERTVRDEFNHQAYNNNDGTDDWSSDWVEVSDDNSGPLSGFLAVVTDVDDYQLKVERNNRSIYRTADLTGAETATLSFDYRRQELSNATQLVRVEVSSTGPTGTWIELDSIVGPGTDASYTTLSYDISNHISNETTIRLYNVGTVEGQYVLFDNIQIVFTTNDPPPPPGPEADFTVNNDQPIGGEEITFTDLSTGDPTYRRWNFGDGTIVEIVDGTTTVNHTYSSDGTYTVELFVSNEYGDSTETKIGYIVVTNDPPPPPPGPIADFTVDNEDPEVGQMVTFSDESTGSPTYWRWDLGDGTIVENQTTVEHSYSTAGTYTVELFVSNANGSSTETKFDYITVTDNTPPPTGERTVRDEFNHQAYNNNDGTDDWSSDWVEVSDDNSGPTAGFLAVVTDVDDYQLKVERNNRSIYRTADLSGAETATLSFDYRREELGKPEHHVLIEISSTGPTGEWTEVGRITGEATDTEYLTASYDISDHISSETTLRLYNVGTVEGQYVLFDNIQIAFTVILPLDAVDDGPVDAVSGEAVAIPVLANDVYTPPATVTIADVPVGGAVAVNPDNSITYTANTDFSGNDSFTYTLSDGTESDTATVTVTVASPSLVAVDDGPFDVVAGEAIEIAVLDNDTYSPSLPLDVAVTTLPGGGVATVNPDNTITYTPTFGFSGNDSFVYTLSDGLTEDTATVTVAVTGMVPIANFAATPITGTVPLTVTFSNLSTGIVENWAWTFGDGVVSDEEQPTHRYTEPGVYTVTLVASNAYGDSEPATATVTVLASPVETASVIRRISYRFGGQLVATRVEAWEDSAMNIEMNEVGFTGLFYVHGNHLGSVTALSYGQDRGDEGLAGTLVPDSVSRFLPFGGYRADAPASTNPTVSDRGFTGHKHNDYIKLVDMQARWYAPEIGRFISPDTIVPDPANPQSFNRYSYVNNNAINYTDPTGHCATNSSSGDDYDADPDCWAKAFEIQRNYGITMNFLEPFTLEQLTFFDESLGYLEKGRNQVVSSINEAFSAARKHIWEPLQEAGFDALGYRGEISGGEIVGAAGSLDLLWNFNSLEFSIFLSASGSLGLFAGADFSPVGVTLGFNIPNNSTFHGWGGGIELDAVLGQGVNIQLDIPKPNPFSEYLHSGDPYFVSVLYSLGVEGGVKVNYGWSEEIYRYDHVQRQHFVLPNRKLFR